MSTIITKTVKPSGGDFTSVGTAVAWFQTNYPDFVTADIAGKIEIGGTWDSADTAQVAVPDLVSDATHGLNIYTDVSNRASETWDSGKYSLQYTAGTYLIYNSNDYLIVDGLQINLARAGANRVIENTVLGATNEVILSNCLIKSDSGAYDRYVCYLNTASDNTNLYVYNCIAYGASGSTVAWLRCGETTCTMTVYNSTLTGGANGILRSAGTCVAKNVYSGGQSGDCYSGTITKTTCASSDATGSVGLQSIAANTTQFVNVTGGSENYQLAGVGSALYHAGTDTSGDSAPMNFIADINGEHYYDTDALRSIGADEVVSSPIDRIIVIDEGVGINEGPFVKKEEPMFGNTGADGVFLGLGNRI
jgi:hypothetical protein